MQRLIIRNFGSIKDLDMELKDFMAFIGPQASGKSTIAKAVYFFKSLKEDLLKYFLKIIVTGKKEREPDNQFVVILKEKFQNYWGINYHEKGTLLRFSYTENIYLEINFNAGRLYEEILMSSGFKEQLLEVSNSVENYIKDQQVKAPFETEEIRLRNTVSREILITEVTSKINALLNDDRATLFIPAGRSLLTTLSNQKQIYVNDLDDLMKKFVELINSTRKKVDLYHRQFLGKEENKSDSDKYKLIQYLMRSILKGDYVYDDIKGERLHIGANKFVELPYTSSGQQESLWILLLVYLQILSEEKVFLVIEEPEAHLYPEAQKNIMELVALLFNTTDNQVMITTHSPYILSSVNNLLYANKIGQQKNGQVGKIVPELIWLDAKHTAAYKLENGVATYIMDDDMNMIKAEQIDTASDLINEEFDIQNKSF